MEASRIHCPTRSLTKSRSTSLNLSRTPDPLSAGSRLPSFTTLALTWLRELDFVELRRDFLLRELFLLRPVPEERDRFVELDAFLSNTLRRKEPPLTNLTTIQSSSKYLKNSLASHLFFGLGSNRRLKRRRSRGLKC